MKKIAIYGRVFQEESTPYVRSLFQLLQSTRAHLLIYEPFMDFLSHRFNIPENTETFTRQDGLQSKADYLFSIGGDGTLLDSTTFVRDSGLPIIGINTGRLGFLSSISLDEIEPAIKAILAHDYTLDPRALLKLETDSGLFERENFALNELTIHKKDSASMITINTWVDGVFLNSYWADGLIIATPTGSTAYSLSCGGPIVMPGSDNFVITPVAPHNLNVRPIVIPDSSTITLKVTGRSSSYLASLDSRSETMEADTVLHVRKNDFSINLLRLKNHNYQETIRNKLNWGLDQRN